MAWAAAVPLIAAGIGAAAGEMQGRKARRAQKDMMREQQRLAKLQMLAQAYGLQGPSTGLAQTAIQPSNYAMQGALAGAQMARLNKNLWGSSDDKIRTAADVDETMYAMNTAAPQNYWSDPDYLTNTALQTDPLAMPGRTMIG